MYYDGENCILEIIMANSCNKTLKLKRLIYCSKTQTSFMPRTYPPLSFLNYLVEENPDAFEEVGENLEEKPASTTIEKSKNVEVKAINTYVETPPVVMPEKQEVNLNTSEDKVKVRRKKTAQ